MNCYFRISLSIPFSFSPSKNKLYGVKINTVSKLESVQYLNHFPQRLGEQSTYSAMFSTILALNIGRT